MRLPLTIFILFSIILAGCKENTIPKPHGYLKISLPPNHDYFPSPEKLPFKVNYSTYASWSNVKVSSKSRDNSLWFNVTYPQYNAKIHLSYIPINNNLDSLLEESHKFVFEHTVRADAIDETSFHKENERMHGVVFDLQGNSASNMEFWATDSTNHFLRGALYFETTPNVDSLAPIINYIKSDIMYMVNNLEWTCL